MRKPRLLRARRREVDDDNQLFWDEHDDTDKSSLSIICENRGKTLAELCVKDSWVESDAYQKLQQLPKSGLWVPGWIARAANHPTRARVLSLLVSKFESDRNGRCRARSLDPEGNRWWLSSTSRLAKETLLPERAVERSLKSLASGTQPLILRQREGAKGSRFRLNAKSLILAYFKATNDVKATDELRFSGENLQWWDSLTRVRANEARLPGVRVHDAVMVICDYQPGPAALLSTILYWHGVNAVGLTRARITRNGRLWIAKSWRQLADELGHTGEAIEGWRRWLSSQGYIRSEYWVYNPRSDFGRSTLHLRPVPTAIGAALNSHSERILKNISEKKGS